MASTFSYSCRKLASFILCRVRKCENFNAFISHRHSEFLQPVTHYPVRRIFNVSTRIRKRLVQSTKDGCQTHSKQEFHKKSGSKKKKRLDELCREQFPEHNAAAINSWILQGKVRVAGQPVLKPGTPLAETSIVEITASNPKYVCRAGLKLEAALEHFRVPVRGVVAMDAGISTGGFTHCLLINGADRVYGIDVGYGQVSEAVRTDPRVVVMERTNLRLLTGLPELVDLVSLDLSFISILSVMPAVLRVMKPTASLVTLIKPQFEALREDVGEGGIVRDPEVHSKVLSRVINGIEEMGFKCQGFITSPIKGAQGNIEFLAYFLRKQEH